MVLTYRLSTGSDKRPRDYKQRIGTTGSVTNISVFDFNGGVVGSSKVLNLSGSGGGAENIPEDFKGMWNPSENIFIRGNGVTWEIWETSTLLISPQAQIILNKFDNGDYIIPIGINSGIELVRNGSVTSELFISTFNNLLLNGTIIDKTITVIPPVVVPPPIIISTEVQAILNKFNNNDYTYPTWFNSNIGFVKDGSITNQEFLNTFNSLLQDGIIVDKTVVIPPIQLNPDNFLPNGNVRVIRVTGILANDYEVTDGVALANLQSYLDSGVFRLLTQAELDYVAPPVEPPVEPPVIKEYDVNTYRINQFGGVYNEIIYGIDDNRLLQLESQFLVTLVGSPTPSDQEVKDFYNYIDIDTSVKPTMVSQRFLAFKIVDGYLQGKYSICCYWIF
jgi:hypothetical protein